MNQFRLQYELLGMYCVHNYNSTNHTYIHWKYFKMWDSTYYPKIPQNGFKLNKITHTPPQKAMDI